MHKHLHLRSSQVPQDLDRVPAWLEVSRGTWLLKTWRAITSAHQQRVTISKTTTSTDCDSRPPHNPMTIHMETSHVMNMLQLTCLRSRSGRGGGVKSICAPRISWDYRWVPVQTETLLSLVFSAWAELERFVLATDKLRIGGDTSYVWDAVDLRPAKMISTTLYCSVLAACRVQAYSEQLVGCTLREARGSSMSRHCLGSRGRGGDLWGELGGLGSSFLVAGQAKGCLRDHLVTCGEDG